MVDIKGGYIFDLINYYTTSPMQNKTSKLVKENKLYAELAYIQK